MRVAIIAPPYPLEEAPAPPLGVTYVAAAFEAAGAEVKILDYIVNRYTPEKLKAELDAFQPDAVGATSVTLNFYGAADIVRTAKRHNPDIITMMGGPHVSFDAENTLTAYPEIDLIVRGRANRPLPSSLPRLKDREILGRDQGNHLPSKRTARHDGTAGIHRGSGYRCPCLPGICCPCPAIRPWAIPSASSPAGAVPIPASSARAVAWWARRSANAAPP